MFIQKYSASIGGQDMPCIQFDSKVKYSVFKDVIESCNPEEKRKIKENLVGYFSLLNEWSVRENEQ